MKKSPSAILLLVVAGILITGVLPALMYWYWIGRAPTVTADEARVMLREDPAAVMVDARAPEEFKELHLEGAINLPYEEISEGVALPPELSGKKLLFVCESGILAAQAAIKARTAPGVEAYNVKGGLASWYAATATPCPLAFCRLRAGSGETRALPEQPLSTFEQWVVSISAFGVKPGYMLLSFALILWLWKQTAPDLRALRWAMIWFLTGEGFCALNYLFFGEDSFLIEYLHMFGMVLAFGFTTFAAAEGLDLRVLHFSDPAGKCAVLPLCGSCIKYAEAACGGRRVLLLVSVVGALISLIPLTVHFQPESYNSRILGVLYNYSHPVIHQLFEIRYAPLTAMVLFLAAAVMLGLVKDPPLSLAKVLTAAGAGFIGFSWFRLVLFHAFRGNLTWFVVWEEVTELIYVAGVAAGLWIFRGRLFEREPAEDQDG